MGKEDGPNVLITPNDVLNFRLSASNIDVEDFVTLTITNRSENGAVAYKIKTTKPKKYLVRPNSGLVKAGTTEAITIILVKSEKKALLQEFRETGSCDESNKFLVQCLSLSDELFDSIRSMDANDTSAKLAQLWAEEGDDASKQTHAKLKVKFSITAEEGNDAHSGDQAGSAKNNLDAQPSSRRTSGMNARYSQGELSQQDKLYDEVKALRHKYDDLVAFTVNLTAEKDLIQRSLVETMEDLAKERKTRELQEKEGADARGGKALAGGNTGLQKQGSKGFTLLQLLLFALGAFVIGQWWRT